MSEKLPWAVVKNGCAQRAARSNPQVAHSTAPRSLKQWSYGHLNFAPRCGYEHAQSNNRGDR